MALYQPSNCLPSTFAGEGAGTVNAAAVPRFSWQVNGNTPLTNFYIEIFDEEGRTIQLQPTSFGGRENSALPFDPTDEYGNPRTFVAVYPDGSRWSDITLSSSNGSANISDGKNYTWRVVQFFSGASDTVTSVDQQFSPSFFRTRTLPTLTVSDPINGVTALEKRFTATYSQAQGDGINWVRWRLEKHKIDGVVTLLETVDDTGEIYTAVLEHTYTALEKNPTTQWRYRVVCTIETQSGVQRSANRTFDVDYEIVETQNFVTASCTKDNAGLVEWTVPRVMNGSVTPANAYSINNQILSLDTHATAKWQNKGSDTTLGLSPPYAVGWRGIVRGYDMLPTSLANATDEQDEILCSAFSDNGQWFFVGGNFADTTTSNGRIFAVENGRLGTMYGLTDFEGAVVREQILAAAFSPNSERLVIAFIGNYPTTTYLYYYKIVNNVYEWQDQTAITRYASPCLAFWNDVYLQASSGSTIVNFDISTDVFQTRSTVDWGWIIFDMAIGNIAGVGNVTAVLTESSGIKIISEGGTLLGTINVAGASSDYNIRFNPVVSRQNELLVTTLTSAKIYRLSVTNGQLKSPLLRILKRGGTNNWDNCTISAAAFNACGDTLALGYIDENGETKIELFDAASADYSPYFIPRTLDTGTFSGHTRLSTLSISKYGNLCFIAATDFFKKFTLPITYDFPFRSLLKVTSGANVIEAKIVNFHIYVTLTVSGVVQKTLVFLPNEYGEPTNPLMEILLAFNNDIVRLLTRRPDGYYDILTQHWDYTQAAIDKIEIYGLQSCKYIYVTSNPAEAEQNIWAPTYGGNTLFLAKFENGLQAGSITADFDLNFADIWVRGENGLIPLGRWDDSFSKLKDYGLLSKTPRRYLAQYVGLGSTSPVFEAPRETQPAICRRFTSYTLIEAKQNAYDTNIYHALRVWLFGTNLEPSAVSDNYKPAFYENFTQYPLRQRVTPAPKSGTLTGLLNNPTGGKYSDTAEQIRALYTISDSPHTFFLKDMKGEMYMVHTSAPITTQINTQTAAQETTISIPWQEVGSTDGVAVIQLNTSPYWED